MNPKRIGHRPVMQQVDPDFDFEAYKNRYKPNSIMLDPITNKTYNVCKRRETNYRSRRYGYLNVNRLPLEFSAVLEKGYPLMLTNENETFLLEVYRIYPAAEKWQNITCKIFKTPLQFCEAVETWQKSHPHTQAHTTT